ncbi:MAG: TfoX/Sxy family protein [Hyphomicrobiaceae bacterium]|nr:TfoX/Sxy family protein [Hyphomicrobiaceae bacterium]
MAGDDLLALLEEHLAPLGPVTIKRMFGGAGLFLDGLMFGLIADGGLYLKSDDGNRSDFEREGCRPFSYAKADGRTTVMSYWQVPERLLDEPDEMREWARKAHAAAARMPRKAKPVPKPRRVRRP